MNFDFRSIKNRENILIQICLFHHEDKTTSKKKWMKLFVSVLSSIFNLNTLPSIGVWSMRSGTRFDGLLFLHIAVNLLLPFDPKKRRLTLAMTATNDMKLNSMPPDLLQLLKAKLFKFREQFIYFAKHLFMELEMRR